MKTVHFFAFYLTICPKLPFLPHGVLWTPKIQNLYILMVKGGGVLPHFQFSGSQSILFRCAISPLQISTSASLRFCSCFYDDLLLILGWFTPAFMMRWFNIDWIPMDIALIMFLPLIAIFSCREYKIFKPGKYLFPAERILCSIREPTSFLMRMKCILVKNEVYSRIEHKILSAGNNYFPGLKILYSRQENASINVRNKNKAISMGI